MYRIVFRYSGLAHSIYVVGCGVHTKESEAIILISLLSFSFVFVRPSLLFRDEALSKQRVGSLRSIFFAIKIITSNCTPNLRR